MTDERFGDVGYDLRGKKVVRKPIMKLRNCPLVHGAGYTLTPLGLGRIYDAYEGYVTIFEESLEDT